MKALIVDNIILYKCLGKYYAPSIYNNQFFERYLSHFTTIRVVAKVYREDKIDFYKYIPLDTSRIEVIEIPPYRGIKALLKVIGKVAGKYHKIGDGCDCAIMKVVQLESIFAVLFGRLGIPYCIEVVNDPKTISEGFSLVKTISVAAMNYFVRHAIGVSYITKRVLQEKYPCKGMTDSGRRQGYFYTNYPTIDLSLEKDIVPRIYPKKMDTLKILHVSNVIESDAKGQTTVLKAIKYVSERGIRIDAIFLGEGSFVSELKKMASDLGIEGLVHFKGRVADHDLVMNFFKEADLFVFPSRSEGQGRVNLEAESVGLPCLASRVGGIVELFDDKYLFDPDDYVGFGESIIRLFNNPTELEQMSARNIDVAREFEYSKAKEARDLFYEKLKSVARGKNIQ